MATYSSRLGLKRPDVTDPFLTQDFYDNYNLLDAAPGMHICTSSTKPNWGVNQAGRSIFMTDYRQIEVWDGTNWIEPVQTSPGHYWSLSASADMSRNTTTTYNIGSFTVSRPARLLIFVNSQMALFGRSRQQMTIRPVINGSDAHSGIQNTWRHTGIPGGSGGVWYHLPFVAFGQVAQVARGSVSVGVKVIVGADANPVVYRGSKVVVLLGRSGNQN